ncbi:MAG: hypothetical protein NTU53_02495 [Planctomycetota bacterium]|nr:hypothetical protein [Planctomycetota bacterium]
MSVHCIALSRVGVAAAALAMIVLLPSAASGKFAVPAEVPVERLIRNIGAYIQEHPDDAMGYYTLGRVHNLAFSLKQQNLRAREQDEKLPAIPDMFNRIPAAAPRLDEKALRQHLLASIENYNRALAKEADNPLFHLGLASVLDTALDGKLDLTPLPGHKSDEEIKDWRPVYLSQAIEHYLRAYDRSVEKDLVLNTLPITGLSSLISYEAGTRYLELAQRPGAEPKQKAQVEAVQASVKKLKDKRMEAITPVVFSLGSAQRLDDLLDPSRTVQFDLDGTGRPQFWPWVKADTAILVWDPSESGRVESGRQLFGSVTWWMFWRDGYAALDALDDDRDGWLSGQELAGLAVWFDRNSDGICDPGEVMPIESLGIESIAVHSTSRDGRSPCNRMGIRLIDGRVLPGWDWVAEPVDAPAGAGIGR